MKNFLALALGLLLCLSGDLGEAKAKKSFADRGKLGTSFHFDGSALHGKFQSSSGTTVAVESDKYLENLLGTRKNVNDRIEKEKSRN